MGPRKLCGVVTATEPDWEGPGRKRGKRVTQYGVVSMSDRTTQLQNKPRGAYFDVVLDGNRIMKECNCYAQKLRDECINIFATFLFQRALYLTDRMEYVLKPNMLKKKKTDRERMPSLTREEQYHF